MRARFWHAGLVGEGVDAALRYSHAAVCAHLLFGHLACKGGCLFPHASLMVLGAGVQMAPQLLICARALLVQLIHKLL